MIKIKLKHPLKKLWAGSLIYSALYSSVSAITPGMEGFITKGVGDQTGYLMDLDLCYEVNGLLEHEKDHMKHHADINKRLEQLGWPVASSSSIVSKFLRFLSKRSKKSRMLAIVAIERFTALASTAFLAKHQRPRFIHTDSVNYLEFLALHAEDEIAHQETAEKVYSAAYGLIGPISWMRINFLMFCFALFCFADCTRYVAHHYINPLASAQATGEENNEI